MAVAFETENGVAGNSSASSATFSITPSGAYRVLYVMVTEYGISADPTSVKFNGVDLTKLVSGQYFNAGGNASLWRLIAPDATTANVVVTFAGSVGEYSVAAVVYSGVDQATPNRTISADFTLQGAGHTVNPVSVSGDTVLGFCSWDATGTLTGTPTNNRSTHQSSGFDGTDAADTTATGTTTAITFTSSGGSGASAIGLALIGVVTQTLRPDADLDAASWTTTPLWSKVDEASPGGDVISATSS